MRPFRNIRDGISNLWVWFPVIWSDQWWDEHFLYITLKHKLEIMEEHFRLHGNTVDHKKQADQMKTCIVILDRLIKEEYGDKSFEEFYKKWPRTDGWLKKKFGKEELRDFHRAYNHEEYMINQDIEYLFNTMKKYIRTWWD